MTCCLIKGGGDRFQHVHDLYLAGKIFLLSDKIMFMYVYDLKADFVTKRPLTEANFFCQKADIWEIYTHILLVMIMPYII